jgi:GntR family transcriptional repressor for pyruvate dehydrogenase complex
MAGVGPTATWAGRVHPWQPIARSRAFELVVDRVEEQILGGGLRVGDRLPAERDLATMLGVSRAAVREAIRTLQAQGVVRSGVGVGPDGGTVVAAMPSLALTRMLRLHVALANFPVSDVVEARVMLERWSARLAARAASPEDLDRLAAILGLMEHPDVDRETFNELDTGFHVGIADAGRNRLVADLTTAIRESMRLPILHAIQHVADWPELARSLSVAHRRVFEAVAAGDGDQAAAEVEAHIRSAHAALRWGQAPELQS